MTELGAILGIGCVGPLRHKDVAGDYLDLAADAVVAAAADAGIDCADIDGLVVNSGGDAGADFDQLANFLGLSPRTSLQTWAHGRFTATVIHEGALMVKEGHANLVAVVYSRRLPRDITGGPSGKSWREEIRTGGGAHGEDPRIGLTAPVGTAALAARLYANRYGADLDNLYHVVNQLRTNAVDNPEALRGREVSEVDYTANAFVVEPLRRWDCTPRTEGAVCVLVGRPNTGAESDRAVRILGFQGLPSGPSEFIWSRPGLGMMNQPLLDEPAPDDAVFARAGISTADVDAFYTYDPFSPLVWFALERFGYCRPGEAPAFVGQSTLTRKGSLPTNSHGGSIAAGQLAGWLHIVEAVRQLRREAEARQLDAVDVVHYGTCYGDSLVLGK